MSRFIGNLEIDYMRDASGKFLTNPAGRQLFILDAHFTYVSDLLGRGITVPKNFVTDLASIPRLPIIYLLLNGIADQAGVIHDYVYSYGLIPREKADMMLREACLVLGVSAWKANLIWIGVRIGGRNHYYKNYAP